MHLESPISTLQYLIYTGRIVYTYSNSQLISGSVNYAHRTPCKVLLNLLLSAQRSNVQLVRVSA
jgi:hypothetical protein